MDYIIRTKDEDGCVVLLGKNEWHNHILDKHPEVGSFFDQIIQTIESPEQRHRDAEDDRVYLHYRRVKQPIHKKLKFFLVVIKYVHAPEFNFERTGFVSSVYFLKELKRQGKRP